MAEPGCDGSRRSVARGATPHPRSGAEAGRNYPTSKEPWLRRCRRAERNCSTFKVRRGGCEEIPLVQGKEQQTLFFWDPKSLQMVTAAMKLKDAYSLEGKL